MKEIRKLMMHFLSILDQKVIECSQLEGRNSWKEGVNKIESAAEYIS